MAAKDTKPAVVEEAGADQELVGNFSGIEAGAKQEQFVQEEIALSEASIGTLNEWIKPGGRASHEAWLLYNGVGTEDAIARLEDVRYRDMNDAEWLGAQEYVAVTYDPLVATVAQYIVDKGVDPVSLRAGLRRDIDPIAHALRAANAPGTEAAIEEIRELAGRRIAELVG